MPVSDRSGFHIEFPELPRNLSFNSVQDYENYIARLRGFDAYAAGHIELMREGVRRGMTVPSVILQRVTANRSKRRSSTIRRKACCTLRCGSFPTSIPEAERQRLRAAARAAIAESVVPGYRRFLAFMQGRVRAELPRHDRGFGSPPRPRLLPLLRAELHDGRRSHAGRNSRHRQGRSRAHPRRDGQDHPRRRLRRRLRRVYRRAADRSNDFTPRRRKELVKETSAILKRIDGQLPSCLGDCRGCPTASAKCRPIIAPQATFAYYQPPTGDGTRAGFFYINTFNLPARPLYMLESLSAHEGSARPPSANCPPAGDRRTATVPQVLAASPRSSKAGRSIPSGLGREIDLYTDPYSDFGRLTMEIVAGLPAGGRHWHSLPRLDARQGDRLHARQLGDVAARHPGRSRPLHRLAGPGARRTRSAS